jgi:two-component system, OmpR family, response regulator MtrA
MRVLVVEDDAELRTRMWKAFADGRHEVAVAADGGEAIEKLHALRPELVVLDLVLPGIDGWSVLRSLRRLPLPPPVILLSPASNGAAYPRAAAEGVAAFMEKPFTEADLLATCERVGALGEGGRGAASDRRGAPRRTLRVPAQILTREQGWWTDGELVDLGPGGARVALPYPLPKVNAVRLAFTVPEGGRLTVQGRLQWRASAGRAFAFGVSFVDLLPEEQRLIDALIEDPA